MSDPRAHCGFCGAPFAAGARWPRRCGACGEVRYANPRPVAVVLLPVDDGLLAIRRGIPPHVGELALPGGFMDFDETWQQAGARELREETGITISDDELVERRVVSAPGGLLLIFGEARPRRSAELPIFAVTDETTERVILAAPVTLAFPLHTDAMRDFFRRR